MRCQEHLSLQGIERYASRTRSPMDGEMETGRAATGHAAGMQQGEVQVLERQLVRRFGPLDEAIKSRLKNATLEQLELWAENILDAATIEDVFRTH